MDSSYRRASVQRIAEDNDRYLTPYLTQIDGPHFRYNGKIYDRYKFLASWEKIKSHVIQNYVQHISHEPWPGYNDAARKMGPWYNYNPRDGTGLGKRKQGILLPIDHVERTLATGKGSLALCSRCSWSLRPSCPSPRSCRCGKMRQVVARPAPPGRK